MIKTYTTKQWYSLVLPISMPDGSTKMIELRGVQNMRIHGSYTTANADEQAAIEATAEFRNGVMRISSQQEDATGKSASKTKNTKGKNTAEATETAEVTETTKETEEKEEESTENSAAPVASLPASGKKNKPTVMQQTLF